MNITMCYSYLLFVNLVTDKEQRNNIGYQLLIAAGLLIFVNFALMIVAVTKKVIDKVKQHLHKKRLDESLRQRQQKTF